jgi:hypothetical protein
MHLELQWHKALWLQAGRDEDNCIYKLTDDDLESIPRNPGVYVFGRCFNDQISPLYIGQAGNLFSRIRGQFNNLRLMKGIQQAQIGYRSLIYAQFFPKPGQQVPKSLDIIESALIEHALTAGYTLLNKQGVKTRTHQITFGGAREGTHTFQKDMHVRAR